MDIHKHMERAQESLRKKNFDYAIALYHQVLAIKPDFGQARSELRQALSKRREYRSASPIVMKILAIPQLLAVLASKLSRNKDSLIRSCEKYLQVDPHNRMVNNLLGKTLEQAGYVNSAVAVYEFLGDLDENDTEALKKAGLIKYRNKDIDGALKLYEKALSINPRDAEAEKMRKNLAAEDTLSSGSYSTARTSRELIKEKDEAAHLHRATRIHKTSEEIEDEIQHLKKMLGENPGDKRALKELGEMYMKKKDYASAKAHYQGMLEDDPESFEIRCRLGDVELMEYDVEIAKISARLEKGEEGSLQEELEDLRKERLDRQVEELEWRVKAHPTDLGLWFEYGQSVYKARKIDEAIQAFQQAVKDPRHRVLSLHMLGRSFMLKGLFDLAEKQLKQALADSGGVTEKSKAICYDLGVVAEKQEDTATAADWYLKIYEIDINYKDVADKIESLKP